MKTSRASFLTALMGLMAFSLMAGSGRAQDNASLQNPPPAAPSSPGVTPPSAPSAPSNKDNAAQEDAGYTTATATWAIIKDYPYDRRSDFIDGLGVMTKRLDEAIRGLNAKRASMTDEAAKDWDFNLKELNDACADLQSRSSGVEKATDGMWTDAKDKFAQAWQRVQNAYDKVKHSTTS